jgi:hypothetical protein
MATNGYPLCSSYLVASSQSSAAWPFAAFTCRSFSYTCLVQCIFNTVCHPSDVAVRDAFTLLSCGDRKLAIGFLQYLIKSPLVGARAQALSMNTPDPVTAQLIGESMANKIMCSDGITHAVDLYENMDHVIGSGATSVVTMLSLAFNRYETEHPEVAFTYTGTGSGKGKLSLEAQTSDWINTDSVFTAQERSRFSDLQM